ncbi:orotidine-5'-phosphate decarboxylase [Planctomycetales bacterium ZRK34]|nr:orotidine-5'-phosphate decarboxylase [Planctomycetales bacterium ZRK34]
MSHFADQLLESVAAKAAPVCVGLDPVLAKLPDPVRRAADSDLDAIATFSLGVVEAVAPHVPCVKIQSACYERFGEVGVAVYHRVAAMAREAGLLVIGDAKRGDIGVTAEHYAVAGLDPVDALTINSYFGRDGIEPFCKHADATGKGLFALVRTSNPGGDAIQSLQLADGRTVAQAVGALMAELGEPYVGDSGYSLLGAVVGATKPGDAAALRKIMPKQIFLVPGFGAQGGGADDVRACFNTDGRGAIITASRSVIYAFAGGDAAQWQSSVQQAAVDLCQQVGAILA